MVRLRPSRARPYRCRRFINATTGRGVDVTTWRVTATNPRSCGLLPRVLCSEHTRRPSAFVRASRARFGRVIRCLMPSSSPHPQQPEHRREPSGNVPSFFLRNQDTRSPWKNRKSPAAIIFLIGRSKQNSRPGDPSGTQISGNLQRLPTPKMVHAAHAVSVQVQRLGLR